MRGLSLVMVSGGLLFVAVCGLLIAVASRCLARALGMWASVVVAHGLSSCGSWALECRSGLSCPAACGIFLDQGSNPALSDGFSTTALPGKSYRPS